MDSLRLTESPNDRRDLRVYREAMDDEPRRGGSADRIPYPDPPIFDIDDYWAGRNRATRNSARMAA